MGIPLKPLYQDFTTLSNEAYKQDGELVSSSPQTAAFPSLHSCLLSPEPHVPELDKAAHMMASQPTQGLRAGGNGMKPIANVPCCPVPFTAVPGTICGPAPSPKTLCIFVLGDLFCWRLA